jgi:hypothetical protein
MSKPTVKFEADCAALTEVMIEFMGAVCTSTSFSFCQGRVCKFPCTHWVDTQSPKAARPLLHSCQSIPAISIRHLFNDDNCACLIVFSRVQQNFAADDSIDVDQSRQLGRVRLGRRLSRSWAWMCVRICECVVER